MNYYIVTGASKGLGEAIVKEMFTQENCIIYLSRSSNSELEELAKTNNVQLFYQSCDLTKIEEIEETVNQVFTKIDLVQAEKLTLINNAGMIEPIKQVGDAAANEIISNVQVNLLAPILLTEFFLKQTKSFKGQTVVVNITSGAANKSYSGWSTYCSTKAGLNMFTRTAGQEQGAQGNKRVIIGFSPGVMDTDMQGMIRTAGEEDFASLPMFKEYHEKGMLRKPSFVAKILVNLINSPLENGRVYDIKEFL